MTGPEPTLSVPGPPAPHRGPVVLVAADAMWPAHFQGQADTIRVALGAGAMAIDHVGSTSVPGLAAKPKIDVLLVVADSSDEASYGPALEAAGLRLTIREPEWHAHRLLTRAVERGDPIDANVHVFSAGCIEITRMTAFRDRLRADAADRVAYEAEKRRLARRAWARVQDYADAKTDIVEAILAAAGAPGPLARCPSPCPGRTR